MSVVQRLQGLARNYGVSVTRFPSAYTIPVDYPVSSAPRYGLKVGVHERMKSLLDADRSKYESILKAMADRTDLLAGIPATEDGTNRPFWTNPWFPSLDAIALMHFILERKPGKFIEIGSGTSTMFARHAITHGGLSTKILSIDPQPRRGIDQICDRVVRSPLEDVDQAIFDTLVEGDILFFDGSHRVFSDSDVTVFFLEILPRIPAGVLIHIHDIFWPKDYPESWGNRYYSEQYMLAMLFLYAPEAYEIVFPNAYVSDDPAMRQIVSGMTPGEPVYGYYGVSFWFQKAGISPR